MMNKAQKLTLLAPARDLEVGKAAIDAGADAVYIGAPRFGARQAASNSVEDIAELVRYAHLFGCQVLVTLNTLLHADEYAPACALAHQLYQVGVDALIIQDLHLLACDLPPIRLHASTQCDNRTPEQVLALQAMGFRRAVLARELSLSEIQAIHKAIEASHAPEPIELEAFVHGALCVSLSGRCYMSEVLLQRSANRGCCAQMCRMRYDLIDKDGNEIHDDSGQPIHQRYLLSLQDMDRSQSLRELIDAGITTFKIEGRLKDREYVTNTVAYYRRLIDSLTGQTSDEVSLAFTPNPQKTFHRGATDYFLHGRTRPLANWKTPKSTGEEVGTVAYVRRNSIGIALRPDVELHNGDGLCFGDQGFAVNRVLPAATQKAMQRVAEIIPNQMPRIPLGAHLYRNQDVAFLRTLHAERHIPVVMTFEDTEEGYRVSMCHAKTNQLLATEVFASPHTAAQNEARALSTIREQIGKLGDTPYAATAVIVSHAGEVCQEHYPYFLPISLLNDYRRRTVQTAINAATEVHTEATFRPATTDDTPQPTADEQPLMTCRYCLLYEMGHCRKQLPIPIEPRYLRLQNGTRVMLQFDCSACQMLITLPR